MTDAVPSNPVCIAVVVYWTCSCLLLLGIFLLCLPLFCSVRSLHVNIFSVKEVGVWSFFLQCVEEIVFILSCLKLSWNSHYWGGFSELLLICIFVGHLKKQTTVFSILSHK